MLVDIPMWMGKFHKAPQIVEDLQPISGYRKLSEETGISTFGHILMLYFNTHTNIILVFYRCLCTTGLSQTHHAL